MLTRIKSLALANGDWYENCKTSESMDGFLTLIKEREFINIACGKQEILINSEFIVSIEI